MIARRLIACVSDWRDSRLRLGVDCSGVDADADDVGDDGLSAPSFASDDDANTRNRAASLGLHRRDVTGGRKAGEEAREEARPAMQDGSRRAVTAALVNRSIAFSRGSELSKSLFQSRGACVRSASTQREEREGSSRARGETRERGRTKNELCFFLSCR